MPYYVICRVSDGATGTRESRLARHGVPLVFQTIEQAEATAEDLRYESQHTRGAADDRYWVVECPSGDDAGARPEATSSPQRRWRRKRGRVSGGVAFQEPGGKDEAGGLMSQTAIVPLWLVIVVIAGRDGGSHRINAPVAANAIVLALADYGEPETLTDLIVSVEKLTPDLEE
jgi:hypothetical protein